MCELKSDIRFVKGLKLNDKFCIWKYEDMCYFPENINSKLKKITKYNRVSVKWLYIKENDMRSV